MTTIYLVRHAEAKGNIERTFQGHSNGPVSENGEKQLECLARRFKKIPLSHVYTSPLQRAVDTAKAVNRQAELPLVLDRELLEICGGRFEGQKFAELPELFPEEWANWNDEPHKFIAPGGESMRSVYERMRRALDRILHANLEQTVAVVSHGCALRNYLCYITDTPFELLDTIPWGDNTSVTRVDFDQKFHPRVVYQNDISHLTEELSTLAKQNWWRKDGSKDEPEEDEGKMLHIDAGELYLKNDEVEIAEGDLITPQGPVKLVRAQVRVAEGTVFLNDSTVKLTDVKHKQEDLLTYTIVDDEAGPESPEEDLPGEGAERGPERGSPPDGETDSGPDDFQEEQFPAG